MKRRPSILPHSTPQQTSWTFALPGILPEQTRVLLDARSRTAILLHLESEESVPLLHSFQLTPSAAWIFLSLLQAYPHHCPYHTLFAALYPTSQGEPSPVWEHNVRPIRRALIALAPVLRAFGLEAIALRGHGYVLASSTSAKDAVVSAPASRTVLAQHSSDSSLCFRTKAGEE